MGKIKTKGKVVMLAAIGFVLGLLLMPFFPFVLAYELATEGGRK